MNLSDDEIAAIMGTTTSPEEFAKGLAETRVKLLSELPPEEAQILDEKSDLDKFFPGVAKYLEEFKARALTGPDVTIEEALDEMKKSQLKPLSELTEREKEFNEFIKGLGEKEANNMPEIINQEEKDDLIKFFPGDALAEESEKSQRWLEFGDLMRHYIRNGKTNEIFMLFSDLQAELAAEERIEESEVNEETKEVFNFTEEEINLLIPKLPQPMTEDEYLEFVGKATANGIASIEEQEEILNSIINKNTEEIKKTLKPNGGSTNES